MSVIKPLEAKDVPLIMFHMIHDGVSKAGPRRVRFDDSQDQVARNAFPTAKDKTMDHHLSWRLRDKKFLSCSSSWSNVSKIREWAIKQGFQNVRIIAIWSKGMRNVYKAKSAATAMGPALYARYRQMHLRTKDFEDEYFIDDARNIDNHQILAIFTGDELQPTCVEWLQKEIKTSPHHSIDHLQGILEQIHHHTGVWNTEKFERLLSQIFGYWFVVRFRRAIGYARPCVVRNDTRMVHKRNNRELVCRSTPRVNQYCTQLFMS